MLLKSQKIWTQVNAPPEVSHYSAWLESIPDRELREALIAANVNIMRREAPFAYFFANGDDSGQWKAKIGNVQEYKNSLDTMQLSRGIWFTRPEWTGATTTSVTAVHFGDILPFVYFLDNDRYSLFCSPRRYSVAEIESLIQMTNSNQGAMNALLSDGGCFVSVTDYQMFEVQTCSDQFAKHFCVS